MNASTLTESTLTDAYGPKARDKKIFKMRRYEKYYINQGYNPSGFSWYSETNALEFWESTEEIHWYYRQVYSND